MDQREGAGFVHQVEEGDTLYSIGKTYQVTVQSLMCANPYSDLYDLRPGDEVRIPLVHYSFS